VTADTITFRCRKVQHGVRYDLCISGYSQVSMPRIMEVFEAQVASKLASKLASLSPTIFFCGMPAS